MYGSESKIKINELLNSIGIDYHHLPINNPIDISEHKLQFMTGDGNWNDVLKVIRKSDDIMYILDIQNDVLETTGNHKVLTESGDFVFVKDLNNLTKINHKGNWVVPFVEKTDYIMPVIDFELSGDHTYLTNNVISHNTSFGDPYCVDPYTTKVNIQHKMIKETISLAELAERFLGVNDFQTPEIYDMADLDVETETQDGKIWVPIKTFVVKESTESYYTDGTLNGTANHKIIEGDEIIKLKDHPDFQQINKPIHVVDIEVDHEDHSYLANGRLNHNTTSGGKALGFHASVRLRLKSVGQIKAKVNEVEQTVGIKTKAQVVKNRVGPPLRTAEFSIFFDSGIDNHGSWLTVLKDYDLIKQGGAWYTYSFNGNDIKFLSKDFDAKLEEVDGLSEDIYNKICDIIIMKYRTENLGIDDVIIDKEPIPDEN